MLKKKKRISVLVILAMVLTLLGGMGAPAAANSTLSGTVVGHVPTIASPGYVTLASIRYSESGFSNLQTGNTIEVMLPEGFEFQTGLSSNSYYEATSNLTVIYSFSENNRKITYDLTRVSLLTEAALLIKLPAIVIGNVPTSGNIMASVTTNSTAIGGGTYTVAHYGPLSVDFSISPTTVPVLSKFGPNPQTVARNLIFKENGAGAFRDGSANKIVLTLPHGVLWANSSYPVQVSTALPGGVTVTAVRDSDTSKLNLILNGGVTNAATTFTIVNPTVNVSYLAVEGDLILDISGSELNSAVSRSEVLATVAGWGVTVRRQMNVTPFEVMAGRQSQTMANVEIVESTPGSLPPGGTVTLTLPEGLKFYSAPTVSYYGLQGTQPQIEPNTANRTITMNITGASSASGSILVHFNSSGNVLVSPGASGEVSVNVGGTAGATGSVTVANVIKPVQVSAPTVTDITVDALSLTGGEIVIEELGAAGRIANGVIVLELPVGITFSSTPSVTRTAGNLAIGLGSLSNGGSTLTIPVNTRSTQLSKITVGNINYSIARAWWNTHGDKITVTVEGNSVVDAVVSSAFTASADKLQVVNAEAGAAQISVFTIGSLTYKVGNQTKPMDQEPVIVSDRTMLPLRFVGEAIGLREDDILWDPVKRSVTLFRGDRVAQVTIGSTTMLINGAPVEMDVAPQIMNGRTMLPIRWIGLAFRVDVEWDAVQRTVTVTP